MPKGRFAATLTVKNGKVTAEGTLKEMAAGEALSLHWLIDQRGTVAQGTARAQGHAWEQEEAQVTAWLGGEATAVGLLVRMTPDGAETFAWSQTVELQIQP